MAKLSVIGTGYLGLTHAACMSSLGHDVIAFDIDANKIETLKTGKVPFHEPGLDSLLQQEIASGRLTFTTSWEDVAAQADVHFLCVGTPQSADSSAADMTQVRGAVQSLAPLLTRPSLVVGKSTVPVGTAQWIADTLAADSPAGAGTHLVWNPEFLREGFAVADTLHPDRIVLGVSHQSDVETLKDVYAAPLAEGTPLIVSDYPTAELVKVAANAFLATKISFINAFADLCDVTGANVTTLADAIGFDTRIGRRFLNAGIGFGGGCLPKDIRALQARAAELGVADQFEFLRAADHINLSRRTKVVELAKTALGGSIDGAKVTVLGAAFKPDSDDIRDSPALSIAAELHENGAHVMVHDPEALHGVRVRYPHLGTADTVDAALAGADIVLHLTEWKEYRLLDPVAAKSLVKNATIIDGRNVLDLDTWSNAGWKISYLGKPGS
jgi:UDPglucose 6-dehydrogenase